MPMTSTQGMSANILKNDHHGKKLCWMSSFGPCLFSTFSAPALKSASMGHITGLPWLLGLPV